MVDGDGTMHTKNIVFRELLPIHVQDRLRQRGVTQERSYADAVQEQNQRRVNYDEGTFDEGSYDEGTYDEGRQRI